MTADVYRRNGQINKDKSGQRAPEQQVAQM